MDSDRSPCLSLSKLPTGLSPVETLSRCAIRSVNYLRGLGSGLNAGLYVQGLCTMYRGFVLAFFLSKLGTRLKI